MYRSFDSTTNDRRNLHLSMITGSLRDTLNLDDHGDTPDRFVSVSRSLTTGWHWLSFGRTWGESRENAESESHGADDTWRVIATHDLDQRP